MFYVFLTMFDNTVLADNWAFTIITLLWVIMECI